MPITKWRLVAATRARRFPLHRRTAVLRRTRLPSNAPPDRAAAGSTPSPAMAGAAAAPATAASRSAPAASRAPAPAAPQDPRIDASVPKRTPKGRLPVPAEMETPDAQGRRGRESGCRFPYLHGASSVPDGLPTSWFELEELPGLLFCAGKTGATAAGRHRAFCDRCRNGVLSHYTPEGVLALYAQRRGAGAPRLREGRCW